MYILFQERRNKQITFVQSHDSNQINGGEFPTAIEFDLPQNRWFPFCEKNAYICIPTHCIALHRHRIHMGVQIRLVLIKIENTFEASPHDWFRINSILSKSEHRGKLACREFVISFKVERANRQRRLCMDDRQKHKECCVTYKNECQGVCSSATGFMLFAPLFHRILPHKSVVGYRSR